MDFSALSQEPLFWVAFGFALVLGVILAKLTPMASSALDQRGERIAEEIERAAELRKEAEKALSVYQQKHRQSMKEAEEIIQKANLEARRITREAELEVEAELKKRSKMAVEKIAQAQTQATEEVKTKLLDLTFNAARELLQSHLNENAKEKLIRQSIADIQKKLA